MRLSWGREGKSFLTTHKTLLLPGQGRAAPVFWRLSIDSKLGAATYRMGFHIFLRIHSQHMTFRPCCFGYRSFSFNVSIASHHTPCTWMQPSPASSKEASLWHGAAFPSPLQFACYRRQFSDDAVQCGSMRFNARTETKQS